MEQQIYVDMKIGESKQVIPMTLKTMKYPTFILSSQTQESDTLNKYDETKSTTFKKITEEQINNLFISYVKILIILHSKTPTIIF
jgi:TRAP-type mannitol/chloroaromatic compound transport system substrate-binding protein